MTSPIERAAAVFVHGLREQRARSPRDAAERAHYAGGPSVDELERRIIARRAGETPAGFLQASAMSGRRA